MMKKKLIVAAVALSVCSFSAGSVMTSQAFSLGSLLKLGGISFVVDKYGSQINTFSNNLLRQNNLSTTYATKVVPIVSIGTSGYVGAAQVTGPTEEVDQVKAVAQLEASFNGIARVKGLVPVDNVNPSGVSRIQGVGVSAIIDIKL